MDPNNSQRLLLGLHSVFVTTTGGDPNLTDPLFGGKGWRNIGASMGNNGQTITAIAMAPSDPNTIYAGTDDGPVFMTTDAQHQDPTWKPLDTFAPFNGFDGQMIMDLEISPTNPSQAFAVTSTWVERDDEAPDLGGDFHVWAYDGTWWSPIQGNLDTKYGGETL